MSDSDTLQHLYPWQESVVQNCTTYEPRIINVVVDQIGRTGKSALKEYMTFHRKAVLVPHLGTYKSIMSFMCNLKEDPKSVLIDIPQNPNPEKMNSMWAAVESIKDGNCIDARQKQKIWDPPTVWVFANEFPAIANDKWKLWRITQELELEEMNFFEP